MDPNLDRTAILPVIDLQAIAQKREEEQRTQAAALEKAASEIRRLPVEAFPELPAAVAGTLRGRGCAIPQPSKTRRENVIRGAFFEPGKSGWAVLCSVDGSSSLLVFRDDRDRNPIELGTTEDSGWLQGDVGNTYVFSHQIGVADRAFIERHAQPSFVKPPDVITHVGINDMFLEKGSSVFYYDHGEWLTLPGSD
jgi:hypothetical protein